MTLLSSGPGYFSCWTALNQCSVVFFTDPASSKKDCMMNCSDCAAVFFKACTEDTDDQLVDTWRPTECFDSDDSLCLLSRGVKPRFLQENGQFDRWVFFLVRSNKALCYYRMWGALQIMFSEGNKYGPGNLELFKYCINSTQHIQDTDHQLFLNKDNCFYKTKPVIDHYILNITPNTISLNQTLGLALIGVQSYKLYNTRHNRCHTTTARRFLHETTLQYCPRNKCKYSRTWKTIGHLD